MVEVTVTLGDLEDEDDHDSLCEWLHDSDIKKKSLDIVSDDDDNEWVKHNNTSKIY